MNKQVELKNRKVVASKHVKLGQKNQKGQTYTDINDIFYNANFWVLGGVNKISHFFYSGI